MEFTFCLKYGGGQKMNRKKSSHLDRGKDMKHLAMLGLLALLAGCATIDGIGQDVSSAARGVQSWF